MNEPMLHYISQAFIHSDDAANAGCNDEPGGVSFTLRIDRTSVSNEQLGKLMDILEYATSEAKNVMDE